MIIPPELRARDFGSFYQIARDEHCNDIIDVLDIIKADLEDEEYCTDDDDLRELCDLIDADYWEYQHNILMLVAFDYMLDHGYDVLTDDELDELWMVCKAYEGFWGTSLPRFFAAVDEVLYHQCDGEPRYAVDSRGTVKNIETGRVLRPRDGGNGSLKVRLYGGRADGKNVSIHRLVARAYCTGYRDGMVVNHIDEDKHNNSAANLEWCTQRENVLYTLQRKSAEV